MGGGKDAWVNYSKVGQLWLLYCS